MAEEVRVGVPDPKTRISDYPHQFSGGMAQRVMIAMALSGEPKLIIADEPTTALDVATQRQVLELLVGACEELSMSMLFITHDMGVVAEVADVCLRPQHDYTQALIEAVPVPDPSVKRIRVAGTAPG